jgi:hypothetical protein
MSAKRSVAKLLRAGCGLNAEARMLHRSTRHHGAVTDASEPTPQFVLVPEEREKWVMQTYRARRCDLVLNRVIDPAPNSLLDLVDRRYDLEKVSTWARASLRAATEHLCLWADRVAPFAVTPGQVSNIRPRPYLLLARAGLEAASHALWTLEASSADECVQRFIQVMRTDFGYHRKALRDAGMDHSRIDQRLANLEARREELSIFGAATQGPLGYGKLVRNAAKVTKQDEDRWFYLWAVASAAAHGQNWFGVEGFILVNKTEYEPNHLRVTSLPDPTLVTEMVEAACTALDWATLRWLIIGGHDLSIFDTALLDVHARMPKKDEADDL